MKVTSPVAVPSVSSPMASVGATLSEDLSSLLAIASPALAAATAQSPTLSSNIDELAASQTTPCEAEVPAEISEPCAKLPSVVNAAAESSL